MASLRVLICGGGIGGPALAFWLTRLGHKVTICERFESLRAGGAQIDLREQGIEVIRKMGLDEKVREVLVREQGATLVDNQGQALGCIGVNDSGKGKQALTSEYEIMRGDLVQILYDVTKDKTEYLFGKSVDHFEQDGHEVRVTFSDGTADTFDILVGADGQGSRIRRAILPSNNPQSYRRLGFHIAYWLIPRIDTDDNMLTALVAPGGRWIWRRSHAQETQVYFILRDGTESVASVHRGTTDQQKQFWSQRYRNTGWQVERFIDGMQTTKNFYSQEVVQVCIEKWHKDRVVLLGDAAHCPSPFAGMGTTSALVGAYVLAGEISQCSDIRQAFMSYEKTLRPFIEQVQQLVKPGILAYGMPESKLGVTIIEWIFWIVCLLRIPDLVSRFAGEDKNDWKLPHYPELHLHAN